MFPVTSSVPPFACIQVEVVVGVNTSAVEIRLVPVVFCAQIAGLDPAVTRPLYEELSVRTELLAVEMV